MIKRNVEQKTPEWHLLRKGKITGTVLKALMSSRKDTREDVKFEIIGGRLSNEIEGEEDYETDMARGDRLEPEARAMFELEVGKTVKNVGFTQSEENPSIASSPDGLMEDDTEAVEIKCPQRKNYVKAWLKNEIPEEYKWQVIQYFVVNPKLQKLYFVVYNPHITVHPIHIIETSRTQNLEDIEKAKVAQNVVLEEVEDILSTLIKDIE